MGAPPSLKLNTFFYKINNSGSNIWLDEHAVQLPMYTHLNAH